MANQELSMRSLSDDLNALSLTLSLSQEIVAMMKKAMECCQNAMKCFNQGTLGIAIDPIQHSKLSTIVLRNSSTNQQKDLAQRQDADSQCLLEDAFVSELFAYSYHHVLILLRNKENDTLSSAADADNDDADRQYPSKCPYSTLKHEINEVLQRYQALVTIPLPDPPYPTARNIVTVRCRLLCQQSAPAVTVCASPTGPHSLNPMSRHVFKHYLLPLEKQLIRVQLLFARWKHIHISNTLYDLLLAWHEPQLIEAILPHGIEEWMKEQWCLVEDLQDLLSRLHRELLGRGIEKADVVTNKRDCPGTVRNACVSVKRSAGRGERFCEMLEMFTVYLFYIEIKLSLNLMKMEMLHLIGQRFHLVSRELVLDHLLSMDSNSLFADVETSKHGLLDCSLLYDRIQSVLHYQDLIVQRMNFEAEIGGILDGKSSVMESLILAWDKVQKKETRSSKKWLSDVLKQHPMFKDVVLDRMAMFANQFVCMFCQGQNK
jgi:hypothetical protein